MTGQWGSFVLDRFIAPKCSELTACLAPELPDPPDYFRSFFLNNVLILSYPDKGRSLAIVFLRRLMNATRAYRDGRDQMLRCEISIPRTEAHVIRHFQERMPYRLFVPEVPLNCRDGFSAIVLAEPTA
jgi:hypothetical protein